MRVLVTGHDGYVGRALWRRLEARGHQPVGLDAFWLDGCAGGAARRAGAHALDLRDVRPATLAGCDAVVHLAGLCNDPLGDLDPVLTRAINTEASVALARAARAAGVARFLFASSCSVYGAAGDGWLDESSPPRPLTPYAASKLAVERELAALTNPDFSPTALRLATAWGWGDRLRGDLVVNELAVLAVALGEMTLKSDGSAWRPLVHVEDLARAFVAVLEAPRERVHGECFAVAADAENHRIADVARLVAARVPGARVRIAAGAGADPRSYRVSGRRLAAQVPEAAPRRTLAGALDGLLEAVREAGLGPTELAAPRFSRLARVRALRAAGRLDAALRPRVGESAA